RGVGEWDGGLAGKEGGLGVKALVSVSLARRAEPGVVQMHSLVNRAGRHLDREGVEELRPLIARSLFDDLEAVTLADVAGMRHEVRLARESYGDPKTLPDLWVHRTALRAQLMTRPFHSRLPACPTHVP